MKLLTRRVARLAATAALTLAGAGLTGVTSAGATTTPITQSAPTAGTALTTYNFTDQLATTDSNPVTYIVTSTLPTGVAVSSSGAITANGTTTAGTYTLSGTDSDTASNTGTWSYSLTVNATATGALTQSSPASYSVNQGSTPAYSFTATGATGTTSYYVTSTLPSGVTVSSAGVLGVANTVPVGSYTLSGYATDTNGDYGTWSLALTVANAGVTQSTPTGGTATQGVNFTDQLATTDVNTVTYVTTSTPPAGVTVSSSGLITASPATPVGSYSLSGTDSDVYGNTGTWTYALTVSNAGITQSAPTTATTAQGTPASAQLATTDVNTVTYVTTSTLPAGVTVSSSGLVSVGATAPVGSYTLSGTDSDNLGNSGTWSLALTVSDAGISQSAPTTGSTPAGTAGTFQLATGDANTVTYAASGTLPNGVTVSSSGLVSAANTVPVGVYTLSGTDSDAYGNTGTWSFSLTVADAGVTQTSPTSGTVTQGQTLSVNLSTSDTNAVTFTTSGTLPNGVTVSSSGLVSVDATAAVGTYTLSGTTSDTMGNTGTWTYALTVSDAGITQTTPTSGALNQGQTLSVNLSTSDANAVTFTPSGNLPPGVTVSSAGLISVSAATPVGTYTLSGTDSDTYSNTGTWAFALTVSNAGITQSAPTTATATAGTATTVQLATSDTNTVTFTATGTPPSGVTVSSSGLVSVANTLPMGTYSLSGTTSDTMGNSGAWTLVLTVNSDGVTLTQGTPTTATATAGTATTVQLVTTGQKGTETFTATGTLPTGVTVSSSGLVSIANTILPGTFTLSGTTSDTFGGAGTWTLAVTVKGDGVTLTQGTPTTATATAGTATTVQLVTTGQKGTETFTAPALPAGITVSSTGLVSIANTLAPGVYAFYGSATDTYGGSGTWVLTVTVSARAAAITVAALTATTPVTTAYSGQLVATGATGTTTYTSATTSAVMSVSSSGAVSVLATAAPGVYTLSGTVTDALGDVGTWSAKVTVTGLANTVTVKNPLSKARPGATWTPTAAAASTGAVLATTSTPKVCTVLAGGAVKFVAAGTCVVSFNSVATGNYAAATTVTEHITVLARVLAQPLSANFNGINVRHPGALTAGLKVLVINAATLMVAKHATTFTLFWKTAPGLTGPQTVAFVTALHNLLVQDLTRLAHHRVTVTYVHVAKLGVIAQLRAH